MAGSKRRYHAKEERTISEARLVGLSKSQRQALSRISPGIWVTAKEVATTTACLKALVKRNLMESQLIGTELCYRLK